MLLAGTKRSRRGWNRHEQNCGRKGEMSLGCAPGTDYCFLSFLIANNRFTVGIAKDFLLNQRNFPWSFSFHCLPALFWNFFC